MLPVYHPPPPQITDVSVTSNDKIGICQTSHITSNASKNWKTKIMLIIMLHIISWQIMDWKMSPARNINKVMQANSIRERAEGWGGDSHLPGVVRQGWRLWYGGQGRLLAHCRHHGVRCVCLECVGEVSAADQKLLESYYWPSVG